MDIKALFQKFINAVEEALVVVRSEVKHEDLVLAAKYIEEAAAKFLDNPSRREWVVNQLMTEGHLPESIARITLEVALRISKKLINAEVEKTVLG